MTKLHNIILIVPLIFSQIACGQTQANQNSSKPSTPPASPNLSQTNSYPNLKTQARQWAEAFDREDYDKVASLTYPKQVVLMGGREEMARILSRSMKRDGWKMLSTRVEEPKEIIRIEQQLFAVVPTRLKMKAPQGVLVGNGFLIGVSNDNGETWTFVDGSGGRKQEKVETLLPAAAGRLKLPELNPLMLESEP